MAKITDATKAFTLKIQSLYDVEKQLEKALPKMAKASTDPELAEGFLAHLEETKGHSERLELIFEMLDASPKKTKSEGIRGIIEDGSWIIEEATAPDEIRDSMIAGAARYAEHYEMAGYMNAIEEAKLLGLTEVVELLSATLKEEENADKILAGAMKKALKAAQ
jgi:ferritin-like metal-binding protein YciE